MKGIAAKVWAKVQMGDHSACWPWAGTLTRNKPTMAIGDTTISPRKLVWEMTFGARPPPGRHVEVTCGNTHCLNPAHLTCPTTTERFWSHVQRGPDCWIWTGAKARGTYGCFGHHVDRRNVIVAAHRFAYELANGPIEGHVAGHPELEICVCHRCDNPICVRPDHLFLGNDAVNIADCIAKGRNSRGERHSAIMKSVHERSRTYGALPTGSGER